MKLAVACLLVFHLLRGTDAITPTCGLIGMQCCPGSKQGTTCYGGTGGVCNLEAAGAPLQCRACGKAGGNCCPGSMPGNPCARRINDYSYPRQAYCAGVGTGTQLKCTNCDDYGEICCPGKQRYDACALSPYPKPPRGGSSDPAFCDGSGSGTSLVCKKCDAGAGTPCCPGSRAGSKCTIIAGIRDYVGVFGYCAGTGTGPQLTCTKCGDIGQVCCPTDTLNTRCNLNVYPYLPAKCVGTGTGTQLRCVGCGTGLDRCCPGQKLHDTCYTANFVRKGTCEGTGSGGSLTCEACEVVPRSDFASADRCCPGSVRNDRCNAEVYGYIRKGYCASGPPGTPASIVRCLECDVPNDDYYDLDSTPCCPGRTPNSQCGDEENLGYCKGTGTGLALLCTRCGHFWAPCCPGATPNQRCGTLLDTLAGRYATCVGAGTGASLQCRGVRCGYVDVFSTLDIEYPCCPGSVINSACGWYDFSPGYCKGKGTGLSLTCKKCNEPGTVCCPGSVPNSKCTDAAYCAGTGTGVQLKCTTCTVCSCPFDVVGSPCRDGIYPRVYPGSCVKKLGGVGLVCSIPPPV